MNPANSKRLAVAIGAIATFTSVALPARAADDRAAAVKDAAAQSVKAGKAFDAIMQIPDNAIPRDILAHAEAIAVFHC